MSIINTNKPNFFGNNGEVLINGFIYIGEPGQNPIPEENQKTVTFTDAAGSSFTAAQPLRTNGAGKIQYNNKAIIATVDGDYSQLIQDANQVDIKDGFTPTVSADTSGGGSTDLADYTENGLLLADVKQLVKSPGQTVRSVGKASTEDGEGAFWLVVSNTGGNADDVDLIDFDNGLQGVRIHSPPPLIISNNLSDVDDVATARTNLSIAEYVDQGTISMVGGAFSAGEIDIKKIGKIVTITNTVTGVHTLASGATTNAIIPAGFIPDESLGSVIESDGQDVSIVRINNNGTIFYGHFLNGGTASQTTINRWSCSYSVS